MRVGAGQGRSSSRGSPLGHICGMAKEATDEAKKESRWGIPLQCSFGGRRSCGVAGRLSGVLTK